MNGTNMPGFTAESSIYETPGHYWSAAIEGSAEHGVVPQMRAVSRERGWPFSGSCGCGPGVCCCILCWFDNCYFWCWSEARLSL
jgi:hypothetical protein